MSLNDNRDNSLDLLLTVTWKDDFVVLIDQTKLPNKLAYVRCKNYKEVANAIKKLVVRGAPAIGITAALGLALASIHSKAGSLNQLLADLDTAMKTLQSTRPTAVNLFWALKRVMQKATERKSIGEVKKYYS